MNSFLVVLLAIGLNIVLIPKYGVTGAAMATSVAILLSKVLQRLQVRYFAGTLFISFSTGR